MLSNLIPFDSSKQMDERITDRTIGELIHAAYAIGGSKDRCADRCGTEHYSSGV